MKGFMLCGGIRFHKHRIYGCRLELTPRKTQAGIVIATQPPIKYAIYADSATLHSRNKMAVGPSGTGRREWLNGSLTDVQTRSIFFNDVSARLGLCPIFLQRLLSCQYFEHALSITDDIDVEAEMLPPICCAIPKTHCSGRKDVHMYRRIAVGVSALLLSGQSDADQPTIKGYMFGDYYYIASGADKEQNGFQIRRIYLTLDKTWNTRFSGRFRLESSDAGFGVGDKMRPAVKDAYLKYKRNSWSLVMGLSPTPATSRTDGIWGYRSVAKSIQDLNKLGSTRDTGLLFETPLDARGKVVMQAMFGNGSGNQSETNNGKKGHLRLELSPGESLGILLNGDYESRPDQNLTTLSALVHSSGNDRAFAIEGVW